MKQGKDIMGLAQELQRQMRTKRDAIVPMNFITMYDTGKSLHVRDVGVVEPNDYVHGQIAEKLDIPKKYYDRMKADKPELLAHNVNTWFQNGAGQEKRMLRTMTRERDQMPLLRAFLSDRYRRLDNWDLMNAVMPFMMQEYGKPLEVASCEVTDNKLYVKVIAPHTEKNLATFLKPGTHSFIDEPIRSGFIVQNSEIGMGAISVFPFTDRLKCTNGMIVADFGKRKYHSGGRAGKDDEATFLSDQTMQLEDAAFWSRVKDTIKGCLSEETVGQIYTKMALTMDNKIEAKPDEAVTILANKYGLNEDEKGGILAQLVEGGLGMTQFGLLNAVNAYAREVPSYDRASDLEKMAGDLMTIDPRGWKELSQAKAV